ncbi:FixH family protein [Motilimonas eburnea]|uniref:FixH family protein n=1 Tax=Motilimonas eburnea TaxID=1737488 RepID=UPI001E28FBE4|nr:FixH family protein [Motilimonas eburnea]
MKNKWYQQSSVWLIILLPLAAVIAGISTVMIAHDNKVDLVAEDYYKTGKAINADLSKLNNALKSGITTRLVMDGDQGVISIASGDVPPNQALKISFYHATLSGRDFTTMLSADAAGHYRFTFPSEIQGKWAVRVEPFDSSWRVQNNVTFPITQVILDGKQ